MFSLITAHSLPPAFYSPGPFEIALIFGVVLILFGPGKLPEVFKALGAGMKQFKDAANGTTPPAAAPPTLPENPTTPTETH